MITGPGLQLLHQIPFHHHPFSDIPKYLLTPRTHPLTHHPSYPTAHITLSILNHNPTCTHVLPPTESYIHGLPHPSIQKSHSHTQTPTHSTIEPSFSVLDKSIFSPKLFKADEAHNSHSIPSICYYVKTMYR